MGTFKAIKKPIPVKAEQTDKHIDIETLEGTMHAKPGDYIVTGPDGEQWPVKKEIFEKTYKIIEEKG
ncbi:MAG: PGDYG domain-containing protein [Tetragenococcus koreensis]|nr:PGDYG domain-containing protein [Tetragenococcus koreensis]